MNQARKTELRALAAMLTLRPGQEFDGECHLTAEESQKTAAALLEALDEIDALERHIKLHAGDTISLSNDVEIAREQAEENFERAEAAEAKLAKVLSLSRRVAEIAGRNESAPEIDDLVRLIGGCGER